MMIWIYRKLKRKLRSSDASTFLANICTPEYDSFLKVEATGAIYKNLMKKVTDAARTFKVTLSPDFGKKAIVVLPTLVETAVAAGSFSTLVAAVTAADLAKTLDGDIFTIIAPNDAAFAKLPEGTVEGLLADIPKLSSTLTFHVLQGRLNSKKLTAVKDNKFATVNGAEIQVKVSRDGEVTINGAVVVAKDIKCSNGIIHVIDTVLTPP
jgi:uncharacterized surface protein with fasciclin (FAS1) repeats